MRFLRTNTAVIITVGPFYDKTDGVTIETALTITNERITLTADTDAGSAPTNILDNVTGATSGTSNDLNYITGNDAGMMQLELAAADVNRLGRMFLSITDAANHVPVFHEFMVVPALVYDTFFASSGGATFPAATLASTTNITAGTLTTVTTATNVTTVNGLAASVITAASIATDAITAAKIAADAIGASELAADAVTEIATGVWQDATAGDFTTASSIGKALYIANVAPGAAGGHFIAGTNAATSITTALTANITGNLSGSVGSLTTNNDKTGYGLSSAAVQAIWDALTSALTTVGSIGKKLSDWVVGTIDTYTGNTKQTGDNYARLGAPAGASVSADIAALPTASVNAAAVWDRDATGHQTQGTFGQAIGDPVADTNTIYKAVVTDATGATVGVDVVAIKAETVNILADTDVIGATGAGLTSLASQASVNTIDDFLDTEIAAIITTLGAAGAGLTDLGGMSTTMKAQVEAEVNDALVAQRLDELLNADSDIDGAQPPTVGSVFHEALTKTAGSFTYDQTTDALEALRDRGDVAWITATGFSTLDAAGVRTAVGLASANLDTQLTTIDDFLDTEVAAIKAKTDLIPASPASTTNITAASGVALSTAGIDALFTRQLTESYSTDGSAPTVAQALMAIMQTLNEFAVSSTTITVKKLDGTTTAFILTLDNATTPTSSARTS